MFLVVEALERDGVGAEEELVTSSARELPDALSGGKVEEAMVETPLLGARLGAMEKLLGGGLT
jgi:hypothetical protein